MQEEKITEMINKAVQKAPAARDSRGVEIGELDYVRLDVKEMIGRVSGIQPGGIMTPEGISPARITVSFNFIITCDPGAKLNGILVLKPPTEPTTPVES